VCCPVSVAHTTSAAPAAKQAAVSFAKDVKPIFDQSCVKCHGGDKTEIRLKLTSYAGVMAGSENGPVVLAGKAADSELIKQVLAGKMPKRANRLPDAQLKILQDWVNAGALNN
jgi:mono/diheme cytochrome c family protein